MAIDTLRADHLSHYGYKRDTGKGLDAFARQATRFEHAYAPTGWTSPSVASLLTGLHPERHHVRLLGQALPKKWQTLAEVLHRAGYTGIGNSFNHNITRRTRFHRGFAVFESHNGRAGAYDDISKMMNRAKLWMNNGSRPFFMYLQPMNVHGPYRVPNKHRKTLLGRTPRGGFTFFGGIAGQIMRGELELRRRFSKGQRRSLVDQYDTAIRYTSDQLGGLLRHMQERGIYDETLIVITSDHGEELFDHGGFNHGYSLHREVLHVPLYIKLPGQTESLTVKHWVSLMDVFPTIVDALGLEVPPNLHGRSLAPLLRGEPLKDVRKLAHVTSWRKRCTAQALSWDRYKLVQIRRSYEAPKGAVRLYDLEQDPAEMKDVSAQHPDVVDRYRAELERMLTAYAKGHVPAESVLDQMDVRRLKALGYVQ